MSYCRWSSDDWKCDLYCYHSCGGGYITHVASQKYIDVPVNPHSFGGAAFEKWLDFHEVQMAFLDTAEMKEIGLPHDGMSFNDPDLEAFLERVNCLKETGYIVPHWVFEMIEEEIESQGDSE